MIRIIIALLILSVVGGGLQTMYYDSRIDRLDMFPTEFVLYWAAVSLVYSSVNVMMSLMIAAVWHFV